MFIIFIIFSKKINSYTVMAQFLKFIVFKKINDFNYNIFLREIFLSFFHAMQSRNPERSTVITQLI